MLDILIPKKVNLIKSKEMHGHVRLDIHHTKSGLTERIEKHNVITTAANEFMWKNYLTYLRSQGANRPSSLHGGIYGGVFLFKDPISGGNMLPLGGNHLVGYAGDLAEAIGNRGIFNAASSEINAQEGVAKTVWEWATGQATGQIGSVARTHNVIGNGYFGSRYYSWQQQGLLKTFFTGQPQDYSSTATDSYTIIGFDKANDKAYLFNSYTNKYYEAPYSTLLTNATGNLSTTLFPRNTSLIAEICASDYSYGNAAFPRWLDVDNRKVYSVEVTQYGANVDGKIKLHTLDLDLGAETSEEITLAGCHLSSSSSSSSYYYPTISNGYMYVRGMDPEDSTKLGIYQIKISDRTIRFFNLTDAAAAKGFTVAEIISLAPWGVAGIGLITLVRVSGSIYAKEMLIEEDGTVVYDEPGLLYSSSSSSTDERDRTLKSLACGLGKDVEMVKINHNLNSRSSSSSSSSNCSSLLAFDYMATICNLDSAVTKSASDTLKLTYTLSDR